ncbi:MAG TPA: GNAT family N-acetyltransferase [Lysobacter sp.]|nr:GNAT family N-acetyltransferase [Lysobacter sp.]
MSARIRPALAADLAAIRRIYVHEVEHGTATYEWAVPDADEMTRRWRAIVDGGHPYLVAERDGRVAGYAYASAYRAREGYRWTVEDSLYVDLAFRGRGIGHALLSALIARCEALGYRCMVAVIGDATNRASIALHERLGFRIAGRFPALGRMQGRWLENVQMLRSLGPASTDADDPPLPARD